MVKSTVCSSRGSGEATVLSICVSISNPNKLSGSLSFKKGEGAQFVAVDVYSTWFIWGTDREAESLCLKQGQAITLGRRLNSVFQKFPASSPNSAAIWELSIQTLSSSNYSNCE